MLKIHKSHSKHKLFLISITSICSIGAFLGIYTLTYTPELSHAESVSNKKTLASIEYMQDITPQICTNTPEADASGNNQYQLKDSRDGKTYWVAKLKDGNCWMTQNLDLDLANRKLTSSDSDVSSDWASTTGASTLWTGSSSDYNIVKYYDPGEYVYTKPTNHLSGGCGLLNSNECKAAGWELMSGASADSTRNETTHYLAGNYYSWGAATAGQAASLPSSTLEEATQSICPRGWRLPINSGDKSYTALLDSYGTNNGLLYDTQDIRLAPLYFMHGGFINKSTMLNASNSGYYWSSTPLHTSNAYNLLFNTSVYSSFNVNRYYGFSIRCVASGGEGEIKENNISITITPTITLDITNEIEVKKSNTNPSTAALPVFVASNQPYSVSISSTSPNMTSSTSSTIIPSKSGALTTNENAWGIRLNTSSTYTQITTTSKLFYSSTTPESKTLLFDIGISTASDIPNGEYSTDITITATQN